ncbi:MAG: glycosyltransferase [bacterium]|nr:glycosyltransferase [bacterium]
MKIALIHDYLSQDGGAERVLRVLQEIWPEAPTFSLFHDRQKAHPFFKDKEVRTSFLQRLPFGVKKYKWFLPIMPAATESYNLSEFDIVLSSSSAFAKGVLTRPQTLHICYCHTPTRFLWSDSHSYVEELPYNRLIKIVLPMFLTRLRIWDRLTAERVDHFIANSQTVAGRIKKYYGREAQMIIYPPVETAKFHVNKPENYYLAGGRLVAYKRLDIVVQAFNRLKWPLKIFGRGPEENKLRAMAKNNIEFLGHISDEDKANAYSRAVAYLHPQIEDFGITAVEAMAAGRPVLAYAAGGATETVVDNLTGKFFYDQNWQGLVDALIKFRPANFIPERVRAYASQFDTEIFKKRIREYAEKSLQEFQANQAVKPRLL